MADSKKYYYMRLKEGYFDSDEQKILERMPDGYLYSNILLKLYLKSLKNNGKLMLTDSIPYDAQMIATVTGHQIGTVKQALQIFERLGIIKRFETGEIYMMDIQNFVGESSTEADRVRNFRKRVKDKETKLLNGVQMYDNRTPEIEIEKEIETEQEKEIEIETEQEIDSSTERCAETAKNGRSTPKKTPSSFSIILNDGSLYNVPKEDIEEYKRLYPNANVEQALRNMAGWSNGNPTRRKTIRGVKRFINGWLAREQDSGKRTKPIPVRDLEYPDEDEIY